MTIAHPVPFLGRGEEDVGATVVGVVDALHSGSARFRSSVPPMI
jgi:hypothetical protein